MADIPVSPASEEAETGLLCSAFLDPKHTLELCLESDLRAEHFFYPTNATYFALLLEFWQDNEPIEDVTFQQVLRDRGGFDQMGGRIKGEPVTGAAFFTAVRIFIGTAYHAANYIEIVKEKAMRRMINLETSRISGMAMDSAIEMGDIYSRVEATMMKVMKAREGQKIHSRGMKELVLRATDRIQAAIDGDGKIAMPYGIAQLDYETQGLRAPEVTVISGKSSDGKTALALNVAEELAIWHGKRVGIISLEMSDDQLVDRLLASMAWVNIRDIKRSRQMSDTEREKIAAAAARLGQASIFIRDDGQLSISEIGATFAAWKAKHGLDVGIIDHAQLAKGDGRTSGRTEEVEQVSRALKPMAKRLDIPLLVLSQVTEDEKKGTYKTKNSMALTEDADNLLTISHRDGASWINIDKQRDGERGQSVPVIFISKLMRFKAKAETEPDLVNIPPAKKGRK